MIVCTYNNDERHDIVDLAIAFELTNVHTEYLVTIVRGIIKLTWFFLLKIKKKLILAR